jgi:methionine-rich copper-binding protein CopC
MRFHALTASIALATIALTAPSAASAHAKVVASSPAQGSTAKAPRVVTLIFSEALLPPTAAASIVMTAMPGVKNHGEMVIRNFTTSWSKDNKTMNLKLRQPLRAGTYDVRWQAAGADGHRMKGSVSFTVG